jgi:hypothetical protein
VIRNRRATISTASAANFASTLRGRVDDALRYALSLGVLDAFTIGAESKFEQEDLIRRIAAA